MSCTLSAGFPCRVQEQLLRRGAGRGGTPWRGPLRYHDRGGSALSHRLQSAHIPAPTSWASARRSSTSGREEAFIGLSRHAYPGRPYPRSDEEGVTFSQRQCLDILREMGAAPETMTACGGGARSAFWRQMLADALNCGIATSRLALEGPALGAPYLLACARACTEAWPRLRTRSLFRRPHDSTARCRGEV